MKKNLMLIVLAIINLIIQPSFALPTSYTVSIPANSGQRNTVNSDICKAIQKLHFQLTSEKITCPPQKQSMALVEQYQYAPNHHHVNFKVSFNKQAFDKFLNSSSVITQANNPSLMLWAFVDSDKPDLITEETPIGLKDQISKELKKAQITLAFPELNLKQAEYIDTIKRKDTGKLIELSQDYNVDGILIATIKPTGQPEEWYSDWIIHPISSEGLTESSFQLTDDAHHISLELIRRFHSPPHQDKMITPYLMKVRATNIQSENQQNTLLVTLKKLTGVDSAVLDGVTPGEVLYKLRLSVDKTKFLETIKQLPSVSLEEPQFEDDVHVRLLS